MLTKLQQDALLEVATIGMGHATTSLFKLIGEEIVIEMRDLWVSTQAKLVETLHARDELAVGVYSRVTGDLEGTSLLLLPRRSALRLADVLRGKRLGTTKVLDRMDRSALMELGSIFAASYMTGLANTLKLEVKLAVPSFIFDFASRISSFVLKGERPIEGVILYRATFSVKGLRRVGGYYILLLDAKSLANLLSRIEEKLSK